MSTEAPTLLTGQKITTATVEDFKNPDLRGLWLRMQKEPALLHPPLSELEVSFAEGMAAVAVDANLDRIVGYTRFETLMGERLKEKLGLISQFPNIWEMGSSIVFPEYRNHNISTQVRLRLISGYQQMIDQENLLIIGTTKTSALKGVLRKLRQQTGLDFQFCHREKYPFIAPLTCICKPPFGSGYQLGEVCPEPDMQSPHVLLDESQLKVIGYNGSERMFCTMFVSSIRLAEQANKQLRQRFGERPKLVQALIRGYYSNG